MTSVTVLGVSRDQSAPANHPCWSWCDWEVVGCLPSGAEWDSAALPLGPGPSMGISPGLAQQEGHSLAWCLPGGAGRSLSVPPAQSSSSSLTLHGLREL